MTENKYKLETLQVHAGQETPDPAVAAQWLEETSAARRTYPIPVYYLGNFLAAAGFILGSISSEGTIVGIGQSLGRGTVISIVLVMFALPQILLLGWKIIEKTSFSVQAPVHRHEARGRMLVDGLVRGTIHGTVTGHMQATVEGEANLELLSGSVKEADGK